MMEEQPCRTFHQGTMPPLVPCADCGVMVCSICSWGAGLRTTMVRHMPQEGVVMEEEEVRAALEIRTRLALEAKIRALSRALERAHERAKATPNVGTAPPKRGPARSVSIDEIAKSLVRSLADDPQPVSLRFWDWDRISMKERESFRRIARAIAQEFWTVRRNPVS